MAHSKPISCSLDIIDVYYKEMLRYSHLPPCFSTQIGRDDLSQHNLPLDGNHISILYYNMHAYVPTCILLPLFIITVYHAKHRLTRASKHFDQCIDKLQM